MQAAQKNLMFAGPRQRIRHRDRIQHPAILRQTNANGAQKVLAIWNIENLSKAVGLQESQLTGRLAEQQRKGRVQGAGHLGGTAQFRDDWTIRCEGQRLTFAHPHFRPGGFSFFRNVF